MMSKHSSNFFAIFATTVPMITLSLVTLAANGTVLVMFAVRPSLRRGKNAYIASLAIADFLIGCYMPLAALEELDVLEIYPGVGCRVYLTLRYSLLYVSLLSILFITLDRWWSIHYPFSYRTRHTRKLAAYIISGVWALSVILYALPIFLWNESEMDVSVWGSSPNALGEAPEHGNNGMGASLEKQSKGSYSSHSSDVNRGGTPMTSFVCEVPYIVNFALVVVMCGLLYVLPLVCMWVINCSLYVKIRQRRSVEIHRSMSVTDTFFVTVKSKPTIQITEAPSFGGPPSGEHPSSASPLMPLPNQNKCNHPASNNLYPGYGSASPNMGRRHSSVITSLSPQLDIRHQLNQRRISLPDAVLRNNYTPSPATNTNDCRYVGRKWSGCGATGLGSELGSRMGSEMGSRLGSASSVLGSGGLYPQMRAPGDDLVHELLVKQDQKAACCLGLLLAACTLCWLPFAAVTLVRARCPSCVTHAADAVSLWLLLANSAINPFLYGLLNAQFRNILRQWFYLSKARKYRLRDTYIYMGVQKQPGVDSMKETSNVCLSSKVP